ncbi:MAG: DUF1521 domain-containing protein [Thermoanaerobaculia bacterium]
MLFFQALIGPILGAVVPQLLGGIFGGDKSEQAGGAGGGGGLFGGLFKGLLDMGMQFLQKLLGQRQDAAAGAVNQAFQPQPQPTEERPIVGAQPQPHPTQEHPSAPAQPQPAPSETEGSEESGDCCCCCCHGDDGDASPSDEPQGGLTVEGDTITTEGGYKIEVLGRAEWRITDPDGNTTRIWGDPHVEEGDRNGATSEGNGGWDFKDNTTFHLGDGTIVNVTTVPAGNGTTVTGQLNVVNGDHAVEVTGMDKGMGQIGEVTTDGQQIVDQYADYQDVYQGEQADDWGFEDESGVIREIVGSRGKGEEFVLDDELTRGNDGTAPGMDPAPEPGTSNGPGEPAAPQDDSPFAANSLVFQFLDFMIDVFEEAKERHDETRAA